MNKQIFAIVIVSLIALLPLMGSIFACVRFTARARLIAVLALLLLPVTASLYALIPEFPGYHMVTVEKREPVRQFIWLTSLTAGVSTLVGILFVVEFRLIKQAFAFHDIRSAAHAHDIRVQLAMHFDPPRTRGPATAFQKRQASIRRREGKNRLREHRRP